MKRKIIVANWKMNLGPKEARVLLTDILGGFKKIKNQLTAFDLVFCPNVLALEKCDAIIGRQRISPLAIFLGAQDCFWEDRGAYTGEISPLFLKQLGCQYVIVGHSERRQFLGESLTMINQKLRAVLNNDMTPILCVSETFAERQSGARDYKIIEQVGQAFDSIKLKPSQKIIIAYDPAWVVSSGQAITPEEAEYVIRIIWQKMIDMYPLPIVRNNVSFIYGGSVDENSIEKFLSQDTIDGVLVGAASLNPDRFIRLCRLIK